MRIRRIIAIKRKSALKSRWGDALGFAQLKFICNPRAAICKNQWLGSVCRKMVRLGANEYFR